jgi:hypothetical protein
MSPAGLGPENDCAGEDPAAILNDRPILSVRDGYYIMIITAKFF